MLSGGDNHYKNTYTPNNTIKQEDTMNKMTWTEVVEAMWKFNKENNVTSKGIGPELTAVVVFAQESFTTQYTEQERSYEFSNQNKAFIPNMCSNSIFGNCLDGKDTGVRLDWYIHNPNGWRVEYCYLVEKDT